jgi:dihydrofolate reductase
LAGTDRWTVRVFKNQTAHPAVAPNPKTALKISLIAALADEGVIGNQGKIPWHISEDLKRFKQKTMGHAVIMGRKTFESILASLGRPLPGRKNVVVTRRADFTSEGVAVFHDIKAALEHCRAQGEQSVFIIGGGEIYQQTIDWADELLLTLIHQPIQGDTRFPEINPADWEETRREEHGKFSFVELRKKRSKN